MSKLDKIRLAVEKALDETESAAVSTEGAALLEIARVLDEPDDGDDSASFEYDSRTTALEYAWRTASQSIRSDNKPFSKDDVLGIAKAYLEFLRPSGGSQ